MATTDPIALLSHESPEHAGAQASVVVAVVIFSIRPDAHERPRLQVLLVRRAVEPFAGSRQEVVLQENRAHLANIWTSIGDQAVPACRSSPKIAS